MAATASFSLPPGSLVIADLHLDAASADSAGAFAEFLAAAAARPALLVLGDLFDAWVGPAHARLPGAAAIVAALRAASDRGLSVALVPGNRDFLLGGAFTRASGVALHPDGVAAELGEAGRVLFVHGDELCTQDLAYQRLKRVVRSRPVRWLAPRLPDALALGVARRLRRASTAAVLHKPAETKLQQASEVRALAAAAGAGTLVCGHAHAFRDERLPGGPRWIVLDAFGGGRDTLEVGEDGGLRARSSSGL